jgi:hypothetical protein
MINLLVVDFDYFFPVVELPQQGPDWPYFDWYHAEGLVLPGMWESRAANFLANKLPLPQTSGEEAAFWDRVRISPEAELYYADSNAYAIDRSVNRWVSSVWLYDAHHDCGYKPNAVERMLERDDVSCEDWMLAYHEAGADLHVRYPTWRTVAFDVEGDPEVEVDRIFDDRAVPDVVFDRVFVCRSGTWTPPWLDGRFLEFVLAAPLASRTELESCSPRQWDEGNLVAWTRTFEMAMEQVARLEQLQKESR